MQKYSAVLRQVCLSLICIASLLCFSAHLGTATEIESEENGKEASRSLVYKAKNAWDCFTEREIQNFVDEYIKFLSTCKTERETVAFCEKTLREHGFTKDLKGKLSYRTLRNKALFAFVRGSEPLSEGITFIAVHADSPRLDFKQHPFIKQEGVLQAKTHYYGGIQNYHWLARPLALHGIVVKDNGEVVSLNIGDNPGDVVFTIADLLPHLADDLAKQKVSEAFKAEKLNVILGSKPKKTQNNTPPILEIIQKKFGLIEEDFITSEIEVVPAGVARYVGFDKGLVGGFGQDGRICVYTALKALCENIQNPRHNIGLIVWDKEEVGSKGVTGASSRFLEYCVEDILRAHDSQTPLGQVFLASRALSADVTGAIDPDYSYLHEEKNAAKLGFGPCCEKYTNGKEEASESHVEFYASVRNIFNTAGIPWQAGELGRVDMEGGGSSLAVFLAEYGMNVLDCGPAILAMHSPFELASTADIFASFKAYSVFYKRAGEKASVKNN